MGLSETILAAMIGAIATVSTAFFQLFMAWRTRSKVDSRPKKGTTMRSILAVLALMVASAAGGFLYSEFIKQRNGEDMRAMRDGAQGAAIADRAGPRPGAQSAPRRASRPSAGMKLSADRAGSDGRRRRTASNRSCTCRPAAAPTPPRPARRRMRSASPCAARSRPTRASIASSCSRSPTPCSTRGSSIGQQFEQDLGGARFTGKSFEYAQGKELKAVCVNFMQWSSEHPHIARILVQYGFGEPPDMRGDAGVETRRPGADAGARRDRGGHVARRFRQAARLRNFSR